jgi:glutathione peroxidase
LFHDPVTLQALNGQKETTVLRSLLRLTTGLLLLVGISLALAGDKGTGKVPGVLNFTMKTLDGKSVELAKYQGKVVLFVNVASECGHTPQYKGLQALHDKYAKAGLAVIGVPSNEFGGQEPGTNAEIAAFCKKNYGVQFDMLAKVVMDGKGQCPLYQYLTSKETNPKFGGPVQWNFTKFLVDRKGTIVARFEPDVEPESREIIRAIETALGKK